MALDGQTFGDAAADIERFAGAHFVIADPTVASIHLSGYISGDDVPAFCRCWRPMYVKATRRTDGAFALEGQTPS